MVFGGVTMPTEHVIGATRDMVGLAVVGHTAHMSMRMAGMSKRRCRKRRYKKKRK